MESSFLEVEVHSARTNSCSSRFLLAESFLYKRCQLQKRGPTKKKDPQTWNHLAPSLFIIPHLKETSNQSILKKISLPCRPFSLEDSLGESVEHRHLLKLIYQVVEECTILINHSEV